jgi:hypothetical protein
LGGRGVSWVRYEPHFAVDEVGEPDDGFQVTEDSDESETPEGEANENPERIEYECAPVDYVHWKEFGHSPGARTWEEVTCVWRKVYMSRPALVERFGEELGYKIPLDTKPADDKNSYKPTDGVYEAVIYEIWDKETGKVLWISKSLGKIIDERDDPLQLVVGQSGNTALLFGEHIDLIFQNVVALFPHHVLGILLHKLHL